MTSTGRWLTNSLKRSKPETDLDRLLREARAGKPVLYQGKRAGYRFLLRPIWKAESPADEPEVKAKTPEAIKEVDAEHVEYIFKLGDGEFGTVVAVVGDEPFDFGNLKDFASTSIKAFREGAESTAPGIQVRIDAEDPESFMRGSRQWAELRLRAVVSNDDGTTRTQMILRATNHRAKSLTITCMVLRNHPGIEALVREALDSIRFDE